VVPRLPRCRSPGLMASPHPGGGAASPQPVNRVILNGRPPTPPSNHRTMASRVDIANTGLLVVFRDTLPEPEGIEEHFGQPWSIPSPPQPRVPASASSTLCWTRRDLFELKHFFPKDCFLIANSVRIHQTPKQFSFARDG
jgi:hypothetical protein